MLVYQIFAFSIQKSHTKKKKKNLKYQLQYGI